MPSRSLYLAAAGLAIGGCFSTPSVDDTDGSSTGPVATDSSGTPNPTDDGNSATTEPPPATTTPGTSDSTGPIGTETGADSSDDGDESTGEPPPIECGDGIVAPGELCFDDGTAIEASDVIYDPRLGDVNGDGNADVVYLIGDQIVVHFGDGAGGFGTDLPEETLFGTSMELADVDGDDVLDVVFAYRWEGVVDYARGNGVGGFTLQNTGIAVDGQPTSLVAESINGDDRADIIVGAPGLAIATWTTAVDGVPQTSDYWPTGMEIREIALGDFSGDGNLDMAFTSSVGIVRFRLGDGAGDFGSQLDTPSSVDEPNAIATGDFNGDGDSDIAYGALAGTSIGVLHAAGAAAFGPEVGLTGADIPSALATADLNSDGLDDLIAVYADAMMISVFPSLGDDFGDRVDFPIGSGANSVATGDANNDGVPDIITGNTNTEFIAVRLSTP